jgi:hypothetical protein
MADMISKKNILVILILLSISLPSVAADRGLGIKSAIVPGMGQISAGDGNLMNKNTLKGLGFMAGFVVCLNGIISEAGSMDSYAQQTVRLDKLFSAAATYDEKEEYSRKHEIAWNNYGDSRNMLIVFTGLTVLLYGYNIFDAAMFTVSDNKEVSQRDVSMGVAYQSGVPTLKLNCRF